MHRRILSFTNIGLFSLLLFIWSCTKLDTTNLGSDLLPVVDNINTFADTFDITTSQGFFSDTTKLSNSEDHLLGRITNDPLFGQTTANVYLQLKPGFYPYYFGNPHDTIQPFNSTTDSVVLCLNYKGFWGDSTVLQQIEVSEVNAGGVWDSVNQLKKIDYAPSTGSVLATKMIDIRRLRDQVMIANGKDSVSSQIRIKLDPSFAATFFNKDSVQANALTNAYYSDSTFRTFYKGFAVKALTGNALIYSSLTDGTTRLEIHYRKKNNGVLDTTYSSFKLSLGNGTTIAQSSSANNIIRMRSGPVLSPSPDELYLQTQPGTYANLYIPSLDTIKNRIVHRAQITIDQIPTDPYYDSAFAAPNFLYLDLKDTGSADRYKPIYFDLNPNAFYDPDLRTSTYYYPPAYEVDYSYYGGYVHHKADPFGNNIVQYTFNVTRHVQQIATHQTPNYHMRVFSPYNFNYPQYAAAGVTPVNIPYNNSLAYGRVRVGSGTNPNYKMRMIVIWSKLH